MLLTAIARTRYKAVKMLRAARISLGHPSENERGSKREAIDDAFDRRHQAKMTRTVSKIRFSAKLIGICFLDAARYELGWLEKL